MFQIGSKQPPPKISPPLQVSKIVNSVLEKTGCGSINNHAWSPSLFLEVFFENNDKSLNLNQETF